MFSGASPICARHSGDTSSDIGNSSCKQNSKPLAGHMSRTLLWLRQKLAFALLCGSRQFSSTICCIVFSALPPAFFLDISDNRGLAVDVASFLREVEFPYMSKPNNCNIPRPSCGLEERLWVPMTHRAITMPTKASMRRCENPCLLQASSADPCSAAASSVSASPSGSGAGSGTSLLGVSSHGSSHESSSLTLVKSTPNFLPAGSLLCFSRSVR
mmetsp:Transcript_20487/g.40032  ORF Transcript_20487/g.40032 Transcript_20487/m.40032 type:complete len:214 (+) Transcript_20487:674-1315(+)